MPASSQQPESFWGPLLKSIELGNVVPIVGDELLVVAGPDGRPSTYSTELARRFVERYVPEFDAGRLALTISNAVRAHPSFETDSFGVDYLLQELIAEWRPPTPEPLRVLAAIKPFAFFVSTTFDTLLERALNDARHGGAARTVSFGYNLNVPTPDILKCPTHDPVVFHLFGYSSPQDAERGFAVTEEDLVEWVHSLQSKESRPTSLFEVLRGKHHLLLGNSFPDWLARFFLRITRDKRLRESDKVQYVADARIRADPYLRFFLDRFTKNSKIAAGLGAVDFVLELGQRWKARHPGGGPEAPVPAAGAAMPKGSVFISYCASDASGNVSRDKECALRLCESLESVGIRAWLDQNQLEAGDEYARKIKRYIDTCSVFIPMVSQTTESRSEGFFIREWKWAVERMEGILNRAFILPVVLDETDFYKAANIPSEFADLHMTRVLKGEPTAEFLATVKALFEKFGKGNPHG